MSGTTARASAAESDLVPPAASGDRRPRSPVLIVTLLALSGVVVSLQQTLLLPLLPELPSLLGVSADSASWLVTATLLSGAIATPTIARLADMYGKRRMMVVALTASVAGSLLGALSEALPLLITARALQGIGMALIPVAIAIMRDELPPERVPLGVALMSATLAIGAGVGLPLSGLISEHMDWHATFWLTGAVGVVLLVAVALGLPESPVRTSGTFDVRGAIVLSVALTAVLLALSKGAQWGWTSPEILALVAAGIVLLAVWAPLELRTPNPLVDLRVAARRAVLLVNVASILTGFAMFINMLITTQLLQMPAVTGYGQGLDVLDTGLWMIPNAAAFGLMAPVSAWLIRRFSPQIALLTGAVIMAVAYVGRVFLSDTLAQIVIGSVVVGIGTAMAYGAMPTLVMRAVPVTETASANGLNVLLRSIGTSTASATTAAVTTASVVIVGGRELPSALSLLVLFWIAAITALGAVVVTLPMLRMADYGPDSDRLGMERSGARAQVVHGQVVAPDGDPIRTAVVTVLTPRGAAVDWGQADSEGRFTAVIPDPGDYLVVTTADGWQPRSRIMTFDGASPLPPIVLRDRLVLAGRVADADGRPLSNALVVLTRQSGEAVDSTRTGHDGRYELPRPVNGRYVLTVVARDESIGARPLTVIDSGRDIDVEIGTRIA